MVAPEAVSTLAVNITFSLLAIATVSLRFWIRKLKKLPLQADDYTVFIALVSAAGPFKLLIAHEQNL